VTDGWTAIFQQQRPHLRIASSAGKNQEMTSIQKAKIIKYN